VIPSPEFNRRVERLNAEAELFDPSHLHIVYFCRHLSVDVVGGPGCNGFGFWLTNRRHQLYSRSCGACEERLFFPPSLGFWPVVVGYLFFLIRLCWVLGGTSPIHPLLGVGLAAHSPASLNMFCLASRASVLFQPDILMVRKEPPSASTSDPLRVHPRCSFSRPMQNIGLGIVSTIRLSLKTGELLYQTPLSLVALVLDPFLPSKPGFGLSSEPPTIDNAKLHPTSRHEPPF